MTEQDKVRFKPLDDKPDYSMLKIRIEAACGSKGLNKILVDGRNTTSADGADLERRKIRIET